VRWGAVEAAHPTVVTDRGPEVFDMEFALSLDGDVTCELISQRDRTPWAQLGFHHVAVWCDDLDAERERRVAMGWQWEHGKYCRAPDGVLHELVPRSVYETRLARYAASGRLLD
jgi:hypothetical protein